MSTDTAFHFTQDDLSFNRRGKLSEAQAHTILSDSVRTAGVIVVALLSVTLMGLFSARGVSSAEIYVIGFAVLAIMGFAFWFYILRIQNRIRDRRVLPITGVADLLIGMHSTQLAINDQHFSVTDTEARSIQPGSSYTVYIIPGLKRIVALENHSQANPLPPPLEIIMPTAMDYDPLRG
jgi:hypothetical protein